MPAKGKKEEEADAAAVWLALLVGTREAGPMAMEAKVKAC